MSKQKSKAWFWTKLTVLFLIVALILATAVSVILSLGPQKASEIPLEQAQSVLDKALTDVLKSDREGLFTLREKTVVTVESLEYGEQSDIVFRCSYATVDSHSAIMGDVNSLFQFSTQKPNGMQMTSTEIRLNIDKAIAERFRAASPLSGKIDITFYEVDGVLQPYFDETVVNTCFGGILRVQTEVNELKTLVIDGKEVSIENKANIRRGLMECVDLSVATLERPDNSHPLVRWWNDFSDEFVRNFGDGYWRYLSDGLLTTLAITFFSLIIGVVLGVVVAIVRCTYDKIGKLKIADGICRFYLTVIRGTPVMVQLLIIYFVMLLPLGVDKFIAAVICFGINSGAYVAEIIRGGIMAVDDGQMEAGRSLGFNYVQTMWYIVIPQAFKAVLPALANEFITLLKETSVAAYIGVADLTRGGEIIRGKTFSAFMPLLAVALIYLVMVLGLSYLVKLLERRLHKSDRG